MKKMYVQGFTSLILVMISVFTTAQTPTKSSTLDLSAATLQAVNETCSGVQDVTFIIENLPQSTYTQSLLPDLSSNNGQLQAMAKGDLDNDGDNDILVGHSNGELVVFENTGSGNFTRRVIDSSTPNITNIAVGLYNGDNRFDIVVVSSNSLLWFENNGNFGFTKRTFSTLNSGDYGDVNIVDIDQDNDRDIICSRGNDVFWIENVNNQSINFTTLTTNTYPVSDLQVIDVDMDNDLDIVYVTRNNAKTDGTARRLENNNNAFSKFNITNTNEAYSQIVGFDFDEDGDNDFMLTYGDNVRVYRQEAVNSFLATILGSTLGNYNEVQLTDYDQDGSIEFVYSTENSDDMFFTTRQGGFTFPTNSRVESFNRVGDAIAAFVVDDVDGNGALDVVVGIRNSRELIIENQSFGFVNPATVTYAEDRVTSLIAATVSSTGQLTFTRSGGYAPGLYNFQITNITDGNGDAGMVNFRSSFYVNDPDTEIDLLDANLAPLNTNAPPSVNSGTNFGTIPANSTSSTTFIIQNIGNKELFFKDDPILSFSSNAVFSLSPNSNTPPFINPSDAAAFTIDCQPTTQGVHSAIAYLRTNDCSEPIYRINLRVEASAPLAIDLAHFTAAAQQENILLHWQTNNEQIAEGFEVEWSLTGEDWKKIGFVEAQQQAAQYNFIHETPSTGANYYRLALLSNDFAPEYSDIQSVEMSDLQIKNECTFYPNPVSDQLFVDLGGQFDSEKEVEMSVLRSDGTIVQRGQVINWQPIDLQTLASGIYFIELQQEEVKVRERIVKR